MANIPDKFLDLLSEKKKTFAMLATVMPDGSPQVTPVWFDYSNGKIRVNTAAGRVKHRNLERDGRVAIAVQDPENPYRYIQIRGRVVSSAPEPAARAHIDALAKKYIGIDKYQGQSPNEQRVMYEIEPESAQTMG
jgi:PPOX class probable F420-dependent enzyme